jgi:hypothetical protein
MHDYLRCRFDLLRGRLLRGDRALLRPARTHRDGAAMHGAERHGNVPDGLRAPLQMRIT